MWFSCQNFTSKRKQVGQLSQAIRASACLSLGQNKTVKSVHLTLLYPMALMSTNDHLSVLHHYVCTQSKIMQHLGVNFGGIWTFELFSLSGFLFFHP